IVDLCASHHALCAEHRWAGGNLDRIRTLAQELSDQQPDVTVESSGLATKVVQEQTRNIPIVLSLPAIRSQIAFSYCASGRQHDRRYRSISFDRWQVVGAA